MNLDDKVVCIDDDFSLVAPELTANGFKINLPIKGKEYTIRYIYENDIIGEPSYLLWEIANPHFYIPMLKESRELAFAHWRFEKVKHQEAEYYIEEKIVA